MQYVFRVDGDPRIGGGHVMRCLTLANALVQAGHQTTFVMADAPNGLANRVRAAGHPVHLLALEDTPQPDHPTHASWLRLPPQRDASQTGDIIAEQKADWLIWDHYGLDADWVETVRAFNPHLRVMAIDDLDDRALASDLVLDQTRLTGEYTQDTSTALRGPSYALLRPEFATFRARALAQRGRPVRSVLVTPGMMDAIGLAPAVLDALHDRADLSIDVVMSSASQSVNAVRNRLRPGVSLTLDAGDMAERMVKADLCIGAGGMTSWERCCLGLPTVTVAVASNQEDVVAQLAQAGATVPLSCARALDPKHLIQAIDRAIGTAPALTQASAAICDGQGTGRVVSALSEHLRSLTLTDADQMLAWRNQPRVIAVTESQKPIDPSTHEPWLRKELAREDALWRIWTERNTDLGICGAAHLGDGVWTWSFYIGGENAPSGTGTRMCSAFLRQLSERSEIDRVRAMVRPENVRSLALHDRLGFTPVESPSPTVLAFELQTWDVKRRLRLPGKD